MEGLFKNSEKIKQKKRRENVIEFENQAYISKQLVTLKNDVPLPLPIDETSLKDIDAEKLISFLKEMEFKTFTEKKSRELNVDSEKIKASDQIEKFERKITDSSNNIEEIKNLGFDQYFINLWNYYFSYCEAGFANGTIDDVQLVLKGGKANA